MARILLVDDNQDSRFAVIETLRKLTDHAIEEVDSGLATLERVGFRSPTRNVVLGMFSEYVVRK